MWSMYPLATDSDDSAKAWMQKCFNNASYYRHIVVDCDMFHNHTDILCAGGTGVIHDYKAIILVFRGTTGTNEWNEEFDNLNIKTQFPGGGIVSKFYYNTFTSVFNGGMKDDFLTAKNAYPGYELWVTGYSLGGAMAALAATYISQMQYFDPNMIKLVTFGEMRIGDKTFADRVPTLVPYVYRVVHNKDNIPHIVTTDEGYWHHRNEIWYPNDMTDDDAGRIFIECDEQESYNCSNSIPNNTYVSGDHHTYFQYQFDCIKGLNLTDY